MNCLVWTPTHRNDFFWASRNTPCIEYTHCWSHQLFCKKLFHVHYCVKSSGLLKAGSVWKHHYFFRIKMEKGEKMVWEKQWYIISDGSRKPKQDKQTDNLKISNCRENFLRYGSKHINFLTSGNTLFLVLFEKYSPLSHVGIIPGKLNTLLSHPCVQ